MVRKFSVWLGWRELPDFDGWELNNIIALLFIRVLFVVRIPMILNFGLFLKDNVGRSLEEVRLRILLVADADIHLSFVLDNLLLKNVIQAIAMVVLL